MYMNTQKAQKMQKQSMLLEDLLAGEVHTCMLAGMLGGGTYYPHVSWTTWCRGTNMLAGMLGACIYFMAISWTACSGPTYILAGMLGVHMIYLGQSAICGLKILSWLILAGMLYVCICVKSECTALLNQNRKYEGVSDVGFSSCAAPNYLLSRVQVFQIA